MKTPEQVLTEAGFTHYAAGNGCHEYIKKLDGKLSMQISGVGLQEILSDNDPVGIGVFESDNPGGKWQYQKEYGSFKEMMENEKKLEQ